MNAINEHLVPLLFVYAALVSVLLTYVVTRKLMSSRQSKLEFSDRIVSVERGDLPDDVPEEIAKQLSLMIRYVPLALRSGRSKHPVVHLEERLMLGNVPLTNWVKHDEALTTESVVGWESVEQLSVLKLEHGEIGPAVGEELATSAEARIGRALS